jgi:K+-transporting ATPase ATPase C chain
MVMKNLWQNLRLTLLCVLLFGVLYPGVIWLLGFAAPQQAQGLPVEHNGKPVGLVNVGQPFQSDKYFHPRPSAVGYNGAATGGSNLGPTNPAHIAAVQERLDTLLAHNPGLQPQQVSSVLLTASGGGLDPHISPEAAKIQVARVAKARNLSPAAVQQLLDAHTEPPLLGIWGMPRVNVLQLNLALDALSN